ncbi:MAG: hypothetical protein QOF72_2877, partial [Blastocatellia bacterium]|nr:hypothetical protein [Blastocatellia bacterium]
SSHKGLLIYQKTSNAQRPTSNAEFRWEIGRDGARPSNYNRMRMRNLLCVLFLIPGIAFATEDEQPEFDAKAAERFAKLALACVHKEYPNKISHVLNSDADVAPPRKLTPAFCGCYDWHSSVHGHWLLVRLLRTFPDAPFAKDARDALKQSLTAENLKQEAAYIKGEGRSSFERPYGLSWLLQLCAELREWDDPQAREWSANLKPLEDAAVERLTNWLPKLSHPVRIGEHDQTAFGLGLMFDYARAAKNETFAKLIRDSAKKFFLADKNCPLNYEPSGEDFLSPCLGEADVMRRVLPQKEFANWLKEFTPQIPVTENPDWLKVAISPDPSDPKLAHLDGLNLSRAWMLEGILSALPEDDHRRPALQAAADAHRRAGLAAVTGEHYEGGHWLGSFAVYLSTQRGIRREAENAK